MPCVSQENWFAGRIRPGHGCSSRPALADESEGDQDVARELRDHRDIVSLGDIVKRIERQDHGVVVSVELIRVGKYWVCRPQVVRFVSGRLSRPGMFDPHMEFTCFAQLSSLSF
jgi:hypothetical protein